jgi:hypothetical protein
MAVKMIGGGSSVVKATRAGPQPHKPMGSRTEPLARPPRVAEPPPRNPTVRRSPAGSPVVRTRRPQPSLRSGRGPRL